MVIQMVVPSYTYFTLSSGYTVAPYFLCKHSNWYGYFWKSIVKMLSLYYFLVIMYMMKGLGKREHKFLVMGGGLLIILLIFYMMMRKKEGFRACTTDSQGRSCPSGTCDISNSCCASATDIYLDPVFERCRNRAYPLPPPPPAPPSNSKEQKMKADMEQKMKAQRDKQRKRK